MGSEVRRRGGGVDDDGDENPLEGFPPEEMALVGMGTKKSGVLFGFWLLHHLPLVGICGRSVEMRMILLGYTSLPVGHAGEAGGIWSCDIWRTSGLLLTHPGYS